MYDSVGSEQKLDDISNVSNKKEIDGSALILETLFQENIPKEIPKSKCKKMSEDVDAVYTWVNGSDPDFVKSLEEFQMGTNDNLNKDMHNHRFEGLCSIFNMAL